MGVFHVFFKLDKWFQITQCITYVQDKPVTLEAH